MTLEEYCKDTMNIQEDVLRLRIENERLKIELEETKLAFDTWKKNNDFFHKATKIESLQKENAELNATLDLRRMQLDDSTEIIKELQHRVDTLQGYLDHDIEYDMDKQLAQAKEIIKDLLLMAQVEHLKERYESVEEAEQFLNGMRSFTKEEQEKYTKAIDKVGEPTGVKLFDKE